MKVIVIDLRNNNERAKRDKVPILPYVSWLLAKNVRIICFQLLDVMYTVARNIHCWSVELLVFT